MTATLPRRRPTLTEVLPARGSKPGAIRFTPGQRPGTGLVTIHAGRVPCEYLVVELPTCWDGRAVRLAKVEGSPGSDATAESYDVFVSRNGQDHRCCCRGHERHGHCKHVDTLRALLENGWLDAELANPDADVSSDEAPADQAEPAWATDPTPQTRTTMDLIDTVYTRWRAWQRRRGVTGPRYAELYARLTRSPAARRVWQG